MLLGTKNTKTARVFFELIRSTRYSNSENTPCFKATVQNKHPTTIRTTIKTILLGFAITGLSEEELALLAQKECKPLKTSVRDLPVVISQVM